MSLALEKKEDQNFLKFKPVLEKLFQTNFEKISTGSAQQLDHAFGKVLDLFAPIVTKTVRVDRFEPSY